MRTSGQFLSAGGRERPPEARRAFTLIELMVVIAIIAILFLMAIPALQSMSAKNIDSAQMHLTSTLRLARQYAITKNRNVWVVFPDLRTPYAPPEEVAKALTAYAVITTNPAINAYEYVSEWKFLPKGVYFEPTIPGHPDAPVFSSYRNTLTGFPFPNDGSAFRNLCAVMFRPNGKAYNCSNATKWEEKDIWVPLTTSRYYEDNLATGTKLAGEKHLPGVTNIVRIRARLGTIDRKVLE